MLLTGVMQTHSRHINPDYGDAYKATARPNTAHNDVGNGINIEEELLKVSETQSRYIEMLNLYRRQYTLLRVAVGKTY